MIRTLRKYAGRVLGERHSSADDIYGATTTNYTEFVGIIDAPQRDVEWKLRELGCDRNPLSAWKRLRGSDKHEQGSWRFRHDLQTALSYGVPDRARRWRSREDPYQLHIILFELDGHSGTTAVFAHHELAWDAWPWAHYRAKYMSDTFGAEMALQLLRKKYDYDDIDTDIDIENIL